MSLAINTLFPTKVFISVDEAAACGFFNKSKKTSEKNSTCNLTVFDVRFDLADPANYGRRQYLEKGHIPTAIFIDLDRELSACTKGKSAGGRHPLPAVADFRATLQKAGVGKDKKKKDIVLCYDDQCGGLAAARLWWMLNNLGIESYILDGGIQLYDATQREHTLPTTISAPTSFNSGNGARSPAFSAADLPPLTTTDSIVSVDIPTHAGGAAEWPYANEWSHTLSGCDIKRLYFDPSAAAAAKGQRHHTNPSNTPLYVDARFGVRFHSAARAFGGDNFPSHVPHSVNRPWNLNIGVVTAGAAANARAFANANKPLSLANRVAAAKKIPRVLPTAGLRADFEKIFSLGGGQKRHGKGKGKDASTATQRSEAVFSCASGVTACMNIAVAAHCGLVDNSLDNNKSSSSDEGSALKKHRVFLYAGAWSDVEQVNKSYLVDRSHRKFGFRLGMVKKTGGAPGVAKVTDPSTQLRFLAASTIPVVSNGICGARNSANAAVPSSSASASSEDGLPRPTVPKMDPTLVAKIAKHLYMGEIADVFVKTEGRNGEGEDELVGRIEATPPKPRQGAKSKL